MLLFNRKKIVDSGRISPIVKEYQNFQHIYFVVIKQHSEAFSHGQFSEIVTQLFLKLGQKLERFGFLGEF